MIYVRHRTQCAGVNDPSKQVSKDAWNETHEIVGLQEALDLKADADHTHPAGLSLADVIDALYPVGALYTSTLSTNPATLLGRGTWAAFGAGRVMVGFNGSDTDFDAGEKTGGAKTKAISAHAGAAVADHAAHAHGFTPAGTNSAPTFTGNALGTHAHELPIQIPSTTTTRQIAAATFGTGTSRAATGVSANGSANTTSAAVALSQAVSAGTPSGSVSAPTFSGTPGNTGNPSATLTHSVTQPSNHTDLNVVQPYITVYTWKRTA